MATPITWQNVIGQSLADASRPMESAARIFNTGFENIRDVLKGSQAIDEANAKQMVTNRTNEALNQIYGLESTDAFKAAQQQGLFQKLMGQGAMIDQGAVRSVLDGREATLQQRAVAGIDFKNKLRAQEQAPLIDEVTTRMYSAKTPQELAAVRDDIMNNQRYAGLFKGDLAGKAYTHSRELTQDERAAAEEAQRKLLRPLEVEDKTTSIAGNKARNALTGMQIEEAKLNAADRRDLRAFDTALTAETTRIGAERNKLGIDQGAIAKQLGLPLTPEGHPAYATYSPEQRKTFDLLAVSKGIAPSSHYMQGDTQQVNALRNDLAKRFPRLVGKFGDAINSAYDNAVMGSGPRGNERYFNATDRAMNQARIEAEDKNNPYSPNSANAREAYKALATEVPDILKSMPNGVWWGDNNKDLPYLQEVLGRVAIQGIPLKDGTHVVPAVNDVIRFLRSTDGGLRDKERGENFERNLKAWMNKPEALDMQKKAVEAEDFRKKQRYEALLREQLYPTQGGSAKK